MKQFYPGTVIERTDKSAGEFLFAVFTATKGLTLGQIREITGLDTPAIQNWVNRGWVAHPVEKRYSIEHLARILIINMLRECMKFEMIATVLKSVNGDVDDKTDDIITESHFYLYLCQAIDSYSGDNREIKSVITKVAKDYPAPSKDAKKRLETALEVFLSYYDVTLAKRYADEVYSRNF